MAKTKTSKKQKTASTRLSGINLKKVKGISEINPSKELLDREQTGLAMIECLENNDPEGAMEVISIYLFAVNRAKMREEVNLPKSTLYAIYKHKNPTIKTLAKIMFASAN